MSHDISVDGSFSTPIVKVPLTGFAEHQSGLLAHVEDLRRKTKSIQSSNYNGWHSHRFLHTNSEHPDLQWLVCKLSLAIVRALEHLSGSGVDIRLRELWANVNESGSWNVPHIHPVNWAGIVYVSDPPRPENRENERQFQEGDTVFFNPVPEAAYLGRPNTKRVESEPGMMLLFPGYLLHMVIPHSTPESRVTFAFNVDIQRPPHQKESSVPREHACPRVKLLLD